VPPFPTNELSLGNLIRLGLITSLHPGEDVHPLHRCREHVSQRDSKECEYLFTAIGERFLSACEDPVKIEAATLARASYHPVNLTVFD
jgi:hypothetical protein